MHRPHRRTHVAVAIGGIALALGSGYVHGAAFALAEENVMGLGNAFAGAAATAEDANTVWHNPAGLARLNFTQFEIALHAITASAKFNNQGSQAAGLQPLGGNGGDAGSTALVPNLYASMAINDQWHVGIGINVPFGLKTEYADGWLGRYQALQSKIETINVNPSVGWRATKDFWLGAGVNYQKLKATLTNNVNYSGALAQGYGQLAAAGQIPASAVPSLAAATAGLDSFLSNTADDAAWGWNVGAMYSIGGDANNDNGAARIGVAYRSKIKYNLTGNANFTNPTPATLTGALAPFNAAVQGVSASINQTRLFNGGINVDISMPDSASLSYYHRLNERWDILGDVTWTGWSTIKQIAIVRTNGTTLGVLPENFKDTWRLAAGVNYSPTEKVVLRAGVAWDETPVNSTDLSPRLPDGDRTWLTLGARYKFSRAINFDVGAAYIWVKDPSINNAGNPPSVAANGRINGTYSNHVSIVSAQMNYRFR
ncbi:MAG: outer membrane protein transport protein [Casimicrobiaceae bacterium]